MYQNVSIKEKIGVECIGFGVWLDVADIIDISISSIKVGVGYETPSVQFPDQHFLTGQGKVWGFILTG